MANAETLPAHEQAIQLKHEAQIAAHEAKFGKLGELQTDEQKHALAFVNQRVSEKEAAK